jgi:hypothetical protein
MRVQGQANRAKHTQAKLRTKNTMALVAAHQESGQEEGSTHAPRSWPPPKLSVQAPPP